MQNVTDDDINIIRSKFLFYGMSVLENKLSKVIVSSLNWGNVLTLRALFGTVQFVGR